MLRRNVVFALLCCSPTLIRAEVSGEGKERYQIAPSEADATKLLKLATAKIFPDSKALPACRGLEYKASADWKTYLPGLDNIIADIKDDLLFGRSANLQKKFYPRIAKKGLAENILNTLQHGFKKPWDVSIYRVWALATNEGDRAIVPCPDDALSLTTRHSYSFQVAVWFEIMGQNELARAYVSLVPSKGSWRIGAWLNQQWTHAGKDFQTWFERGRSLQQKSKNREAYIAYDMAAKLLHGEALIEFNDRPRIVELRDQVDSAASWPEKLNKLLKKTSIVHADTMFAPDGVGLMLRELVDGSLSTAELRNRCLSQGKQLITLGWLNAETAGLYCSFVIKGEPQTREGVLGGMYFSQKQIAEATP